MRQEGVGELVGKEVRERKREGRRPRERKPESYSSGGETMDADYDGMS